LDSNVLVYLVSSDARKAERASEVVAEGGVVSVQVLNEVAHVLRRKAGFDWRETAQFLEWLVGLLEVRPIDAAIQRRGLALAERFGLSVWDGTIAASAEDAGCAILATEDMQDGLRLAPGLRIENPFA
jgi:predicted nucleic acid-binding protein